MSLIFSLLARIVDAGLSLASGESVWPVLLASGGLCTLAMLGIYRLLSDPDALARTRQRMQARALEMVLYRHDLEASTRAVGRILWANGHYLLRMLLPLAVTTLVLGSLFVALTGWLEWRPLRVGESTVVEVILNEDAPVLETPLELELSPGLRQASDVVRSLDRNAMIVRITAVADGAELIEIRAGNDVERKTVVVGTMLQRVACDRTVPGDQARWFSPLEPAIPRSSSIERISVQMPRREIDLGSWTLSWLTLEVLIIGGMGIVLATWFRIPLF